MWRIAELNAECIARMEDVLALYEKPLAEKGSAACYGIALRCITHTNTAVG
jgi:hypothetical protein